MITCIKGNISIVEKFDFSFLLTPEEIAAEIDSNDVSYISSDEERYPTMYLEDYKKLLERLLDFQILDDVCYSNSEIVLICNNVEKHRDRRDDIPEKIHFLNTMLKGSGIFKLYHTDGITQIVTLKEGDVFLFDPNVNHSFENTSNDLCYMYSLSIILKSEDISSKLYDYIKHIVELYSYRYNYLTLNECCDLELSFDNILNNKIC